MIEKSPKEVCYVCGSGECEEPSFCYDCESYALLNKDSFVAEYVRNIKKYNDYMRYLDREIVLLKNSFLTRRKISREELKNFIYIRKTIEEVVNVSWFGSLSEKAKVQIKVFELFKHVADKKMMSKKEIDEIVHIPSSRYSIFNKIYRGSGVRCKPVVYNKNDIEHLMIISK